jgi:hypothetical protein
MSRTRLTTVNVSEDKGQRGVRRSSRAGAPSIAQPIAGTARSSPLLRAAGKLAPAIDGNAADGENVARRRLSAA